MKREDTTVRGVTAPGNEHILELISAAFPGVEVRFHKLILFDKLQKGARDWYFLIVTRRAAEDRLELAAFSYELDREGKLKARLESRKASFPDDRLGEVIGGLLDRLEEPFPEYREIDLSGLENENAPLDRIKELVGGQTDATAGGPSGTNRLQPGDSGPE